MNRDDHAKNFSFLLPQGGHWQLAPAYDVTHSNWGASWTQTHQMSVNGSFVDITLDDFRAMGDRFEVPGIRETLAEVADAIDQWRDFASTARVNPDTTERIASDLREMRPT